jgi:hypothetical protein
MVLVRPQRQGKCRATSLLDDCALGVQSSLPAIASSRSVLASDREELRFRVPHRCIPVHSGDAPPQPLTRPHR